LFAPADICPEPISTQILRKHKTFVKKSGLGIHILSKKLEPASSCKRHKRIRRGYNRKPVSACSFQNRQCYQQSKQYHYSHYSAEPFVINQYEITAGDVARYLLRP